MKSTTAIKNIRLYKNKINGKPKRVTTGVDDYGNRFHSVKGKIKMAPSKLEAAKKQVRSKYKNTPLNSKLGKAKRLVHSTRRKIENDGMTIQQGSRTITPEQRVKNKASAKIRNAKYTRDTPIESKMKARRLGRLNDDDLRGAKAVELRMARLKKKENNMKTTKEQRQANRKQPVKRVVDNYGDEVLVYTKTGTVKNPHTKERTRK